MIKFIDNIIYSLITDMLLTKKIKQKVLSISLNKIIKDFTFKLYKNSNAVFSKI